MATLPRSVFQILYLWVDALFYRVDCLEHFRCSSITCVSSISFGLFVYGCVGNYDLYLKKVKRESLWPCFSSKNWKFRILVSLLVGIGILFFALNFSKNIWKGFRESDRIVSLIDQAIEERLDAKSKIYYEVHFGTTRNVYDLDVQLTLRSGQIFDASSRQMIENIIKEKLASYAEIGRIRTSVIYQRNGKRNKS